MHVKAHRFKKIEDNTCDKTEENDDKNQLIFINGKLKTNER